MKNILDGIDETKVSKLIKAQLEELAESKKEHEKAMQESKRAWIKNSKEVTGNEKLLAEIKEREAKLESESISVGKKLEEIKLREINVVKREKDFDNAVRRIDAEYKEKVEKADKELKAAEKKNAAASELKSGLESKLQAIKEFAQCLQQN